MVSPENYPLEQYLRDAKILSLYEGTNGIQSMDLMGRKLMINGGEPFNAFLNEVRSFCERADNHPNIGEHARMLARVAARSERPGKRHAENDHVRSAAMGLKDLPGTNVFCGSGDGVAFTGYGNHCTEKN